VLHTKNLVNLYRGSWADCITAAGRSRALAERVGAPYIIETNLSFEGFARFHLDPERRDGLSLLLESTERLQRLRAFLSMSVSLGCCAEALALSGDAERARAYAARALDRVAAREAQGEVRAYRALAIAASADGDADRTREHYDTALAAAARKGSPRDAAITDFRVGEALVGLGATTDAQTALERARTAFQSLGMDWYHQRAVAALAPGAPRSSAQASN
jgi:tetratricopeptide (TPR) repeat protein